MRTALSSINKTAVLSLLFVFTLPAQDMRNADDKKNPFTGQKAALEAGAQRFRSNCAACHGADAEGGRGPALAGNRDLRQMDDQKLFNTIRQGIPGTSMPPSQLPDDQTWQLAAFVRNLSAPAAEAVLSGDVQAGRAQFFGKGECSQCHAIRGAGGLVGPDLTNAGADFTVRDLRDGMLHKLTRVPAGFEPVAVTLRSGEQMEGVAKDNTNYAISVIDRTGTLHLLNKAEVRKVDFGNRSVLPQHDPGGIDDLLAFLAAQTVRPIADPQQQRSWKRIH
jgi:cytochrome c oxidase cbb3-type subunit 3